MLKELLAEHKIGEDATATHKTTRETVWVADIK